MMFNAGGFFVEMKTFIECTYEQMKSNNIVSNSEQFSTDYLGKSKSYFRAMKAKGLEANTALIARLANELHARRTLFEKTSAGNLDFYYDKWRKIEGDVANELALRATDRGSINNYALERVLSAVQTLLKERSYATA